MALMRRRKSLVLLGICLAAVSAVHAADAPPAAPVNTDGWTTILDNSSFWRIYGSSAPILAQRDGKVEEVPDPAFAQAHYELITKHKRFVTSYPANGWAEPDFDDSGWGRRHFFPKWTTGLTDPRVYGAGGTLPDTRQLTLRGKFAVTDPAAVKRLALTMTFRGGAVVYVNGKEAARAFMPAGKVEPGSPAEIYPDLAYVKPDGRAWNWYQDSTGFTKDPEKLIENRCYPLRPRKLAGVEIPSALLRKGINVLGVEIHAPPYVLGKGDKGKIQRPDWSACALVELRLQAEDVTGVTPNVVRPSAIQVWNADPGETLHDIEWGDLPGTLRPMAIVGARNGCFSGRVVVSSDKAIKGLQAKISDLTTADGKKIPAAAIELGYGKFDVMAPPQWGGNITEAAMLYPQVDVKREQGILTAPPAEVAVRPINPGQTPGPYNPGGKPLLDPAQRKEDGLPPYVPGATQPVWAMVNVPKDAAAGDYQGTLNLTVEGEKPIDVPVKLKVCDWTLPDPANYTYFSGVIESPECVALPYDIPLWGDKAWEYAGKSLDYLSKVGNKVLYVMVGAESQYGNAEGMVRWIKGEDGKYTYDFSRVEKYVDLALKRMGKPHFVVIGVWDCCKYGTGRSSTTPHRRHARFTVEDAKTHAVTTQDGPRYDSPESLEFWKPVLTGVYDILSKRELAEAALLGYHSDEAPGKEAVAAFQKILPGVAWAGCNHIYGSHVKLPTLYVSNVWGCGEVYDPQDKRVYGWRHSGTDRGHDPRAVCMWLDRDHSDFSPIGWFTLNPERMILSDRHGMGQIGSDLWNKRDKNGSVSSHAGTRFPGSLEGDLSMFLGHLLYPGPDGPVPTVGFMLMRENIEECEARIFLERLILDKKLTGDVAKKCQDVLDERTLAVQNWCVRSNALRSKLLDAAAEAAKVVGKTM